MDFIVFKYEFEKNSQTKLFKKETNEHVDEEFIRKEWGKILQTLHPLPLTKKSKGAWVEVKAHVQVYSEDIAVLAVHNITNVKQWEEMAEKPTELESYPHCCVIIDNRKQVQQILVEKSSSFSSKPDLAMWMVHDFIAQTFDTYGFTVSIKAKFYAGDAWNFIDDQAKRGHRITYMGFRIGAVKQADSTKKEAELINAMLTLKQITGAALADFKIQTLSMESGLQLQRANHDCEALFNVIARNGYTLNIHSSNGEKFQNTEATKACFAINPLSISAFCEGRTSSDDINLIKRLDEIRNIKGEYKDGPISKGRKKSTT